MTVEHAASKFDARPFQIASDATHLFRRFFNADWYLNAHRDVASFCGSPEEHYLLYGCAEGRAPHPLFDITWYLSHHQELADNRIEPMSHYFSRGWRALQTPHPLFDPARYLLQNTDLIAAEVDPLRHYLEHGWSEGRNLHPLFDTRWYLEQYPDVAAANVDPLSHFLSHGWAEERRPHPLFDTQWYLDQYPDVRAARKNPWLHYIQFGWREGRSPDPRFDAPWYLQHYLDILNQNCEPLTHYLNEGWREGLLPSANAPVPSGKPGKAAPLYLEAINSSSRASLSAAAWKGDMPATLSGLAGMTKRGTVILVVHETEVGGAPHVLRQFAHWMRNRTRFDARIVSLRSGNMRHDFAETAPLLVLSDYPEEDRTSILKDWMGENVCGVFLNSIASGGFLAYMPKGLPTMAFIHELPQVLDLFPAEVAIMRNQVQLVVGGGPEVSRILRDQYDFAGERMASAVSFIEALPPETDFVARRASARAALCLHPERITVMGCGVLHWRKAPEKFVEAAEKVLAAGLNAEFVWLGGGPDHEICEKLVAEKGLQGRVRFTGYEPDVAGKLAAGDIFLLSSQEDPFPLAALYAAQAGMPIICFRTAGGIEGFVERGGGVAVPFMDVAAMAEAVRSYATDPERRTRDGAAGQAQVMRKHTIDVVGPLLLHYLREVMEMPPEVSVVVPNYNYEAYLPERLDSIAGQSFQDFEVILLDDASPDGSVQVLEDFAERRPGTRVVVNTKNSGSPFAQWMRGMELAKADLIWLAEADDRCQPMLLEKLVPMFDDRNMRLAYCASQPVNSDGTVIGDYRPIYLNRITPGRWDKDYVATDHEEANAGLGIANSIPNASAVMFRKFCPEPEFVQELTSMRLCGDWYFYVRAMRNGLVGFSAMVMNDHRRHGNTVTHQLEGSIRYFDELATVRGYLGRTYRQSEAARTRIAEFLAQDIARFNVAKPEDLPQVPTPAKARQTLLMVAPDLSPGGGQVLAILIANEWVRRGGRAVLMNVANQPSHPAMLSRIAPEVMLLEAHDPATDLTSLIARFDVDVIHSGIWWADMWVDDQRDALPAAMPWIISMHGCHETILAHPDIDPSFPQRIRRMTERARMVYTADKNLQVFEVHGRPNTLQRIPNGVADEPIREKLTRRDLGLREDALVLCLASRAIAEKGWHEAVHLTKRLNDEGHAADLLLIGEGPAADEIRRDMPPHVQIRGQVSNLQDYFTVADIGLLPSYFIGESLPLVLIEMMAKGLPIIATEIGEIPWLIGDQGEAAGILVPLEGNAVDEAALYEAAIRMKDVGTRKAYSVSSRVRFERELSLNKMMDRYHLLYTETALRKKVER